MRTIEEYFTHVYQLVQGLPNVQAERYEEHILSATRGNLRIRLRFPDQALLERSDHSLGITVVHTLAKVQRGFGQGTSHSLVFRWFHAGRPSAPPRR